MITIAAGTVAAQMGEYCQELVELRELARQILALAFELRSLRTHASTGSRDQIGEYRQARRRSR
jgi:ribosomal protein L29